MALAFNLNKKGNYEIKWRSFDHQDVGQSFNDADVERSLFINEYIYTKSKCWIIANTVDQVKTGYNQPFPPINQAKITT